MTARVQLRLTGPMDHLRLVWQVGETLLEAVPFREDPDGSRYNALLAVQEILTNVLRYAHHGDDSLPIEVEMTADEEGFAVEIRDTGAPFDPLAQPPRADRFAEELPDRPGGFGILIVRMVMDALDYRREGRRNVFRMEKHVRSRTPADVEG